MAFMSIVSILCSSLVIVGGLHQFLALHPNMHGFFFYMEYDRKYVYVKCDIDLKTHHLQ